MILIIYKFNVIPPLLLFLSESPLIKDILSKSGILSGCKFIFVINSSIPSASGPDISLLAGLAVQDFVLRHHPFQVLMI